MELAGDDLEAAAMLSLEVDRALRTPSKAEITALNSKMRRFEGFGRRQDALRAERDESKWIQEASKALGQADNVVDVNKDMELELETLQARLEFFRANRSQQHVPRSSFRRPEVTMSFRDEEQATNDRDEQNPKPLQPKNAGKVADQVDSALMECDRLLQRVRTPSKPNLHHLDRRTSYSSRVSGMTSDYAPDEEAERAATTFVPIVRTRASLSSVSTADNELDDPMYLSKASLPPHYPESVDNDMETDLPEQELLLQQKARLVRDLAEKSRQETQREVAAMREQHTRTLATYLSELQRRYESKKRMALLTMREQYERETKTAVRNAMEKYEQDQHDAVEELRASLLNERKQSLQKLKDVHEKQTSELLHRLQTAMKTESLRERQVAEEQLNREREAQLQTIESEHRNAMSQWEADKKLELEQEVYTRREQAAANALKEQEATTLALMKEMERNHYENEREELQKLNKALAFGAQAQLQQLRRKLQTEHDEQMKDIKEEAALDLDKKKDELTQLLNSSHRAQREKLERDLATRHRVAIIELQDTLQNRYEAQVQLLNANAANARDKAVREHKKQLDLASRESLEDLEASLERETRAKITQLEAEHEAECARALETLRKQVIKTSASELEAKVARMQQCRRVLLAEAKELLTFTSDMPKSSISEDNDESNEAVGNLTRLQKHLSAELAKYVDVVVDEFFDMAEEQRILVAKITDATQLYLAFKRQCASLEDRAAESEEDSLKVREQLRRKDVMCKKLYLANEELMARLPSDNNQTIKQKLNQDRKSPTHNAESSFISAAPVS